MVQDSMKDFLRAFTLVIGAGVYVMILWIIITRLAVKALNFFDTFFSDDHE